MSQWVDQQDAISRICGSTINFMQFIVDYLIIGFSEKGAISVFVWPEVQFRGKKFNHQDPGYRDALCSLIGENIKTANITEEEVIKLETNSGNEVSIALRDYIHEGERAILTAPDRYIYTF